MLRGDDLGKPVHVLFEELAEAEEHACPPQRRLCGPAGEGLPSCSNGCFQLLTVCQRHFGLYMTGSRVIHVAETAGCACPLCSANPMFNLAQPGWGGCMIGCDRCGCHC